MVAKRKKKEGEIVKKNREKKCRELVELKGLMREKKITYQEMADYLQIALSAFCNKINGISIFDIVEANKISKKLEICKNNIHIYFF